MTTETEELDHVELTVQRMADLHAQHEQSQSPLQRRVSAITHALARPRAVAAAFAVVLLWLAFNAGAAPFHWRAFDAPPFAILELIATVFALFTTMMILATQAREEEAARRRSQLTLQLASLSEQKIAKVIALLQEQRADNPQLQPRPDPEAETMSKPIDPAHVLDRIRDTHDDVG